MIKNALTIVLLALTSIGFAQEETKEKQRNRPFAAIEFGEAATNKFKSYSGELGLKFPNNHLLRLTHMNVTLSEEHLASSMIIAVDGPGVEGKFMGFEAFYDFPIFGKRLHIGPSVGFYKNEYNHVTLADRLKNISPTVGVGLSYRETDIFKVKGLYYTVSFPMRVPFNPIQETQMGDATIRNNTFDNNIWLFIGYEF